MFDSSKRYYWYISRWHGRKHADVLGIAERKEEMPDQCTDDCLDEILYGTLDELNALNKFNPIKLDIKLFTKILDRSK